MRRGLTWDDLEAVLGESPEWHHEDRYAMRGWGGTGNNETPSAPPGHAWRFWNLVWQLRRERQNAASPVLARVP